MALFREVGQLYVAAVSRCRRNGLNDTRSVRQIRLRRRGTGDPGLELHIKTLAPGHPCGHPRSSAGKEQVTGKHPSKRPAGDDCLSTTPSPRHLFFDAIFPIRPPGYERHSSPVFREFQPLQSTHAASQSDLQRDRQHRTSRLRVRAYCCLRPLTHAGEREERSMD